MNLKKKIEKKIKEKERKLELIKKAEKRIGKKEDENIEEDLKFKNLINPFYKQKHRFLFGGNIFLIVLQAQTEAEIEELRKMLK